MWGEMIDLVNELSIDDVGLIRLIYEHWTKKAAQKAVFN